MTGRRFLQYSLALPVVAPALVVLLAPGFGVMLAMGLFVACLPYVAFSAWAWRRLSRMSTYDEARTLLVASPIILATITALAWLVAGGFEEGAMIFAGGVLFAGVIIGFAYVAVIGALLGFAHLVGVVREFGA